MAKNSQLYRLVATFNCVLTARKDGKVNDEWGIVRESGHDIAYNIVRREQGESGAISMTKTNATKYLRTTNEFERED